MISAFSPTNVTPWAASYSASAAVARPAVVLPPVGVRHLLHAANDHGIVHAAGNRHIADAESGRAAGAGRLDLCRFDVPQSTEVRDQGCQVLLVQQTAAEHIADEQGVYLLRTGLCHRGCNRVVGDVPDGQVPMFADRHLSDTDN